jgi:peptide/nickel transport system permease protein
MIRYLKARLMAAVPVVLGVSLLVFASLYLLPGDPVQALVGDVPVEKERLDALRKQLGLDQPPWVQYARFAGGALRGDLGQSLQTGRPVVQEILIQLPATLQLTAAALTFAVLVGVTLGSIAAIRHHTWLDGAIMLVALTGVSIPTFWLGLLLLLAFSLGLRWLPATGSEGLERLVMPAFALGYGASAVIARLTRGSMLEVLRQEYVVTARAKGLRERGVIVRHALKNALIPVITIVGLQLGNLLAGAVVVETVFSRQGVGRLLVGAILGKDFPVVQGTVLFIACLYVLINLVVDMSYALVDPRIRYGS